MAVRPFLVLAVSVCVGALIFSVLRAEAPQPSPEPTPVWPPKVSVEELGRKVKDLRTFRPKQLHAHEIEFRAVVRITRDVPLVQIKGLKGPYTQAHLHNLSANHKLKEGDEVNVRGLIVEDGFGAWMVWVYKWKWPED
jgi:hypothetical protein